MNSRNTVLSHGAMLLFSSLIAGSFSLGQRIANDISPGAITAIRFPLAALVMGLWGWNSGLLTRRDLEAPWRYLVLGGLMSAYFVLMFEGLRTASAVSTAAVFTLMPVMSGVFAYFLLGQIATRRIRLALTVGAAGAVWVIFRADLNALLAFEIGRGEMIFLWGVSLTRYIPRLLETQPGPVALGPDLWHDGGRIALDAGVWSKRPPCNGFCFVTAIGMDNACLFGRLCKRRLLLLSAICNATSSDY